MTEKSSGLPFTKREQASGTGTQIAELKDLVIGYAKQETVDPLKTLGRYLGFGLAGSLAVGGGVSLLLLALLRGLQQIELFNDPAKVSGGTYSWAPYLITGFVGLLVMLIFMARLISTSRQGSK
ncbi:MAG TPA: hypothetical protein VL068_10550 [Microthrixaceae bacterium]|nr:hypothetical protein [Microthrixaceae bacterium]